MKKKILAVIMTMTMVMSLAACGKSAETAETVEATAEESVEAAAEASVEEAEATAEESTEEA